ncbi:MAG: hypothetical protein FWE80_09555 [Oscillospiraceae bacterium]|nr:hypothetical protein [Oscillospiraceae bacterium]
MIKKYLAVVLIIALLSGCTASAPPDSSEPETAVTTDTVTTVVPTTAPTGSPQPPPGPVFGTVPRSAGPADYHESYIDFSWNRYDDPQAYIQFPNEYRELAAAANEFVDRARAAIPDRNDEHVNGAYGLVNIYVKKGTDIWLNSFQKTANFAVETAIIDRDGNQLSLTDLFYDDVDILAYINRRMPYIEAGEEDRKRPFTDYTALPRAFTVAYGAVSIHLDVRDPFFDLDSVRIPLYPDISPYGEDFIDISWQETGIPFTFDSGRDLYGEKVHATLLYPRIRLNDGTRPETDAAVNAAVEDMIPKLEKAGFSAYPQVYVSNGHIAVTYLERDTSMCCAGYSAAVPGGALLWEIETGRPADIQKIVAGREWRYARIKGDQDEYLEGETDNQWGGALPEIDGYVPPAGSTYSDIFGVWGYSLTLTQPDGQRLLMIEKRE